MMKWLGVAVAAVVFAGIGAGCRQENLASAEVQLAAADLNGPANLSNNDRTAFTNKCVARRADLHASLTSRASIKLAEMQQLRGNIEQAYPLFCECLEKGLEKRMSKMQFMMADAMISHGMFVAYPGSPLPEFESFKKAALKQGMTAADFEQARQGFRSKASLASEGCFMILWAPSYYREANKG